MANEDDAASQLDAFCGLGTYRVVSAPAPSVERSDIYIDCSGQPLKCLACHRRKDSADLLLPEQKLWWNFHGYPSNSARHAKVCGYDEFIWRKQFPHFKCEEYCAHVQTTEGGQDRMHYESELVELKRRKGPKGRVSSDDWKKIPLPTRIVNQDYTEKCSQDPDELFYTPEEHVSAFGMAPEDVDLVCEWVLHRGKQRWGCWREDSRREARSGKRATHETDVGNREDAISADQLAKRSGESRQHWSGVRLRRCRDRTCRASRTSQSRQNRRGSMSLPAVPLQSLRGLRHRRLH